MPELPEVECVRLGLAGLCGQKVSKVRVYDPRLLRRDRLGNFVSGLQGQGLESLSRRGKFLWWRLESGLGLVMHLGMTGQLLLVEVSKPQHLRLSFSAGKSLLSFVDSRVFGFAYLDRLESGYPSSLGHIAPDPLESAFDSEAFVEALARTSRGIKTVLLDQRVVSGVGNVYANEVLWMNCLHPLQRANTLSRAQKLGLVDALRQVFRSAITFGGSTFDGLYVHVDGRAGSYGNHFRAYFRQGEPCYRCSTALLRLKSSGTSTHYCPECQSLDS